ncbi:MAG TPA: hypothetical protein VI386_11820 [Candidatus Sulfotelmatobacter sp.]
MPADNCDPPIVTVTAPAVAAKGTGTTISVELQLHAVAVTPLNFTVPLVPRFVPLMETAAPMPPRTGDIPEMAGEPVTVKVLF